MVFLLAASVERAILSLGGIARVHLHRWGDGGAHFHVWFLPRPLGMLEARGMMLPLWEDVLPNVSDEELRAALEPEALHRRQQLADGRLCLEPGQVRAEAVVDPVAEGEVARRVPRDVEALGVLEVPWIAVRRRPVPDDARTSRNGDPVDGRVLVRLSHHDADRRVVTQRLFDRAGHECAIGAQTFYGARILIQAEDQIANQVGRRFVACDEQQPTESQQFQVVQGTEEAAM